MSVEGDVSISGSTNKYFCRDLLVKAGRDVNINFLTMLLTNYMKRPTPSVNIQAKGALVFSEAVSLGGGNMLFKGKKSVSFASKVCLIYSQTHCPIDELNEHSARWSLAH